MMSRIKYLSLLKDAICTLALYFSSKYQEADVCKATEPNIAGQLFGLYLSMCLYIKIQQSLELTRPKIHTEACSGYTSVFAKDRRLLVPALR